MGQALRRVGGRVRSASLEPAAQPKNVEQRPPPVAPPGPEVPTDGQDRAGVSDTEAISRIKNDNVLEERDPEYDAMLSQLVGRIRSKPGGKLEMGEASVVERYNRPMPKLRSSKAEVGHDEQKSAPPGSLTIAQLRHILLLHQGKADDHDGPMDAHNIAKKFRIDTAQVEKVLQFLSLPPENITKTKNDDSR
ncbi:uncharacterized protein LOC131231148 [Magnolia sinica]|uniref:uncharacterized protein LOC131231148 n=1 Tax=Magnolia sinica TaxID=86752 RepID=UPI0026582058|nr:uncharacterized protein LOC131231148 [Magnolia sinica]